VIERFQKCPFDECEWSTADPMHEIEADALEGAGTGSLCMCASSTANTRSPTRRSGRPAPGKSRCSPGGGTRERRPESSPIRPTALYGGGGQLYERPRASVADVAPLLDAKAAARLLGVPESWVLAEARADRIPHVRLGRYVRFEADELRDWWRSRARGPWRSRGAAAEAARLA
jgi:excisionase family DNA binding protein